MRCPSSRRLQTPFTLYVPTALVDGVGEVWWLALEDIVASQNALAVMSGGETEASPPRQPRWTKIREPMTGSIGGCGPFLRRIG